MLTLVVQVYDYGQSGSPQDLYQRYNLDKDGIEKLNELTN